MWVEIFRLITTDNLKHQVEQEIKHGKINNKFIETNNYKF
jgi:hypothetical protein